MKTRPRRESAEISERDVLTRQILTLTGSLVDGGQGGNSDIENAGHMHVVPFFLVERMNTIIHHQALEILFDRSAVHPPGATQFNKQWQATESQKRNCLSEGECVSRSLGSSNHLQLLVLLALLLELTGVLACGHFLLSSLLIII